MILLEVVEVVLMLCGEPVGAAAEQTINILAAIILLFQCTVIPAAFVVNSTVGVRVALNPLGNVTVMVTL